MQPNLIPKLSVRFFSPHKSSKTLQKPKYIKTRNVKPYNYQNYISCLVLVLLSGHLRACQNWNFRTILRPRIQHRYKTSPTRNLVDCSVLYVLGGILKERLYKKDNRALIIISGMKVSFKRLYLADKL